MCIWFCCTLWIRVSYTLNICISNNLRLSMLCTLHVSTLHAQHLHFEHSTSEHCECSAPKYHEDLPSGEFISWLLFKDQLGSFMDSASACFTNSYECLNSSAPGHQIIILLSILLSLHPNIFNSRLNFWSRSDQVALVQWAYKQSLKSEALLRAGSMPPYLLLLFPESQHWSRSSCVVSIMTRSSHSHTSVHHRSTTSLLHETARRSNMWYLWPLRWIFKYLSIHVLSRISKYRDLSAGYASIQAFKYSSMK